MFGKKVPPPLAEDRLKNVQGAMSPKGNPSAVEKAHDYLAQMIGEPLENCYRMCPGCGLQALPDASGNCPYCGKPLQGTYIHLV